MECGCQGGLTGRGGFCLTGPDPHVNPHQRCEHTPRAVPNRRCSSASMKMIRMCTYWTYMCRPMPFYMNSLIENDPILQMKTWRLLQLMYDRVEILTQC